MPSGECERCEESCGNLCYCTFNVAHKFHNDAGSPNQTPGQQVDANTAVQIPITLPILREDDRLQLILPSEYTSVDEIPVPLNKDITLRSLPSHTVGVTVFHGHAPRPTYMRYVAKLEALLRADNLLGEPAAETAPVPEPATEPPAPEKGEEAGVVGGVLKVGAFSPRPSSQPSPAGASSTAQAPAPTSAAAPAPVPAPGSALGTAPAPQPQAVHWSLARYHPHFTLPAFRRNEVWIHLNPARPAVAALVQQHHFERNQQAVAQAQEAGTGGAPALAGEKAEAPDISTTAPAPVAPTSSIPPGPPGSSGPPAVTSTSAVKAELQGELRI